MPADVDADAPMQRALEASVRLPAHAALTGWAALAWMRCTWFDGRDASGRPRPVTVAATAHSLVSRPGITVCGERLLPSDVQVVDGVRVTIPVRSVTFEMRYARDRRAAVRAHDMVAFHDLVSIAEIAAWADAHRGWTGIAKIRDALPFVDENAWSPPEVDLRLAWEELGIRDVVCNHPVFDHAGRHLATPDLLDLEAGVVGEYDGSLHLEGKQRAQDIRREEDLRGAGLEYVTMVSADLGDPSGFKARTLAARKRARAAAGPRRWTLDPPAWWTSTVTVAERRALSKDERRHLLSHRWAA
ncbi:hypothetical protein [Nocardioides luteus]|uniref:hypothetical protein n=1 Tax=Nocardioides luteus TaxID=1844 RepID=UPI001A184529|nr:hypothetical protein [Nocardioides luteus]MBG6099235.1 hypothetical protein [Nocardioides luteus]